MIYQEDFSSTTIVNDENKHLGGYYGDNIGFGEWFGNADRVGIDNQQLKVEAESSFDGSGLFLAPSLFSNGAGTYTLQYQITSVVNLGNGSEARISVWQGTDTSSSSGGDSLYLEVGTGDYGSLSATGAATASLTTTQSQTSTGLFTASFQYDGTSAVALIFGTHFDHWVSGFPVVHYDNIQIISPVPEPSSGVFVGGLLLGAAGWQALRRRARRGSPT